MGHTYVTVTQLWDYLNPLNCPLRLGKVIEMMLFYHTHEGPKHVRNETLPVDGVAPEKHAHPAQRTCAPPEADRGLAASCLLQGHVPFSGQPGKWPTLKC